MMDIAFKLLGGFGEIPPQRSVAREAGIFGWSGEGRFEREQHQGDECHGIFHGALPQG
jgi:hypothetical protein